MPSPAEIWRKFFEACDLPTKIQNKYAETFTAQRIQPNMLKELDKDTLKELGVDTLGDQLAILRYIKQVGADAPAFKLIQSKEPVTTTRRDTPDRHILKAKASSSTTHVPMISRSIAIKKQPQTVHFQPAGGFRSDEILRDQATSRRQEVLRDYSRVDRPLTMPRRQAASPYSIVRQTQLSARNSQRQNPSSSNIRDRITYARGSINRRHQYYD